MVRAEVAAAVAGVPRAVAAAGEAARVEVAAAEEAAAAPVVPAIVATAAVEDLMAAVGDATRGAAGTRVSATTEPAAGGKMSSPSSRASDASRPAYDTGRRPEVPVAVGPMIHMQRGKARYLFLAGIAAHDGDGVLSSGSQKYSRVVPPVLKGEKSEFQKHEFLLKTNTLDISRHFVGQETRVLPIRDPLKQRAVLLREGFSSGEIREGRKREWDELYFSHKIRRNHAHT